MIDKICKMKDKLCEYAHQQMQQGLDRVDTREMGAVIDMIKDLAEAEKSCMEADYYESVVEAMEEGGDRYGYDGGGSPLVAGRGEAPAGAPDITWIRRTAREAVWGTRTSTATGPPTRPTDAAACAVADTPRSRSRTSAR